MKKRIEDEGKGDGNEEELEMKRIEGDYEKNKERVVELLVSNVLNVNIEIPKVVKGAF